MKLSSRATRQTALTIAWLFCAACSTSSSPSSAPPPLFCEGPLAAADDVSTSCDCEFLTANKGNKSPNDTQCSVASMGPGAMCNLSPSNDPDVDTGCACFSFDCDQDLDNPSVICGYYIRNGAGPNQSFHLKHVDPSACVGQHHCIAPWGDRQFGGITCSCQDAACPTGAQDLPSCTDASAQAMLRVGPTYPDDIPVSDCRSKSSTLDGG